MVISENIGERNSMGRKRKDSPLRLADELSATIYEQYEIFDNLPDPRMVKGSGGLRKEALSVNFVSSMLSSFMRVRTEEELLAHCQKFGLPLGEGSEFVTRLLAGARTLYILKALSARLRNECELWSPLTERTTEGKKYLYASDKLWEIWGNWEPMGRSACPGHYLAINSASGSDIDFINDTDNMHNEWCYEVNSATREQGFREYFLAYLFRRIMNAALGGVTYSIDIVDSPGNANNNGWEFVSSYTAETAWDMMVLCLLKQHKGVLELRTCAYCMEDISDKRKGAKYCGRKCIDDAKAERKQQAKGRR